MPPNDASYEIRSIPENTVLIQGLYFGDDSSRFSELQYQFEQISDKMINHDILWLLSVKVRRYKRCWLYEQVLETSVNVLLAENILDWYRESAQRLFWNHNQLFNNTRKFISLSPGSLGRT